MGIMLPIIALLFFLKKFSYSLPILSSMAVILAFLFVLSTPLKISAGPR